MNGQPNGRKRAWLILIGLLIAGSVVFAASYLSATRQRDLVRIACGNAIGHRELTIAVADNARLTNEIAEELGLPIEPIDIHIPAIPAECES